MESNCLNLTLPNHISLLPDGSSLGTSLDETFRTIEKQNNYTQSMHDDTLFCITLSAYEGKIVQAIQLPSVSDRDRDHLLQLLAQKTADPLDRNRVRDSIRTLFATGRFADIQAEVAPAGDGVNLTFATSANFFIGAVDVEGAPNRPNKNRAAAPACDVGGHHLGFHRQPDRPGDRSFRPPGRRDIRVGRPARVKTHGKKREHGQFSCNFGLWNRGLVWLRYRVAICCVQSWRASWNARRIGY